MAPGRNRTRSRPHWWEASALTTAPSLLPTTADYCIIFPLLDSKFGVIPGVHLLSWEFLNTFYNVKCLVMLCLKLSSSYLWMREIYLSQSWREFLQGKFESLQGYACQFLVVKPFLTSDKLVARFSFSWRQCPSGRMMGQICVHSLHPCCFPHRVNIRQGDWFEICRKSKIIWDFNSVHLKDKAIGLAK